MRASITERTQARRLSALVDQQVRDPEAEPIALEPEDEALLATARQLARLPALLGPVDPALERRVRSLVQIQPRVSRRIATGRLRWAVMGLAALLLLALFTPMGQTAVASFMAVFNLGRTEVRITPADTPYALQATAEAGATAIRQRMSLAEAQAGVGFAILQPAYTPPGYSLEEVFGNTYPDLPPWVPQPFSVELVYRDLQGHKFSLRHFPITLSVEDRASISGMNLQATSIGDVLDVDVNGLPGVLLKLGDQGSGAVLLELIWEQEDLLLALSTTDLSEAELLETARSVR